MYLIHKQYKNDCIKRSKSFIFCFKYLPLIDRQKLEFSYHLINEKRRVLVVIEVVSFSADKPIDFHDIDFLVLQCLLKV